jgi:two-component system response regulator DctR
MTMTDSVAIHIVDDDPDMREALEWLFDSRGHQVQSWSDGQAFLDALPHAAVHAWGPAVVVLDIRMEPLSGLTVFEILKDKGVWWPVLFLTGHGDVSMAVSAVKNGAWDFLEKPFQNNVLVDRVESALNSALQVKIEQQQHQQLRLAFEQLSAREKEVLHELLQGHYNKNIADHLGITPRTVEFHRANIFEKMGVTSAVELAHQLGRAGLV